jgi:CheY-like chemotaxis protein
MKKILFIDDQQEPLFYHKVVLERAGYEVVPFASPEKTAEHLESITAKDLPDLIILDINMPTDGRYAGNPQNRDGMRTGIMLFRDMCLFMERLCVVLPPIIVLTQLQNPDILGEIGDALQGTPILDKLETNPNALLATVKEVLRKVDAS